MTASWLAFVTQPPSNASVLCQCCHCSKLHRYAVPRRPRPVTSRPSSAAVPTPCPPAPRRTLTAAPRAAGAGAYRGHGPAAAVSGSSLAARHRPGRLAPSPLSRRCQQSAGTAGGATAATSDARPPTAHVTTAVGSVMLPGCAAAHAAPVSHRPQLSPWQWYLTGRRRPSGYW